MGISLSASFVVTSLACAADRFLVEETSLTGDTFSLIFTQVIKLVSSRPRVRSEFSEMGRKLETFDDLSVNRFASGISLLSSESFISTLPF